MTEGKCPSCSAPIAFTAGTAQVLVCPYCQTVVGRKGPALEAWGRISAVVDTDSPLQLGAHGVYEGAGYRLVGHLQKDQGAGVWDEWYVEFDDGRRGWISESEGAFHLLFYLRDATYDREKLSPGTRVRVLDSELRAHDFVVEERNTARTTAAAGELPHDVNPAVSSVYVDATGTDGMFCTLDFTDDATTAEVFVGRQVPLEKLGISPDQLRPRVKKVALEHARCTECNGALSLQAPDRTKRVACPYCGALLDCSHGRLQFLEALQKPTHEPVIPLGARGTLKGTEWICIGFQVRFCEVEYVRYEWDEYLLFNRARGFTWFVLSNGHWVFLEPIPAGEVTRMPGGARYKGRHYKPFSEVTAVTEFVLGEFYWEVQKGETAVATEYILPPHSLNEDRTNSETTFTSGEYMPPEQVKAAFGLKSVPTPTGIAPSQPNPSRVRAHQGLQWAGIWSLALMAVFLLASTMSARAQVFEHTVRVDRSARSGSPEAMYFSEPFEIPKTANVEVTLSSPLSNNWIAVQGDLVNQQTQEVTSFFNELSYYSGQDWEGAWSEGSTSDEQYLSRVPKGQYVLRLTPLYDDRQPPSSFRVTLVNDVPRMLWMFVGLLVLAAIPIFNFLRASSFETARWNESNLS